MIDPLEQKRIDTALSLFGAVSVIVSDTILSIEDRKYLIEQLVKYYVYYYRYFANIREGGSAYTRNRISLKAQTAKSNIVAFYTAHREVPQITISKLFPNDDNRQ